MRGSVSHFKNNKPYEEGKIDKTSFDARGKIKMYRYLCLEFRCRIEKSLGSLLHRRGKTKEKRRAIARVSLKLSLLLLVIYEYIRFFSKTLSTES